MCSTGSAPGAPPGPLGRTVVRAGTGHVVDPDVAVPHHRLGPLVPLSRAPPGSRSASPSRCRRASSLGFRPLERSCAPKLDDQHLHGTRFLEPVHKSLGVPLRNRSFRREEPHPPSKFLCLEAEFCVVVAKGECDTVAVSCFINSKRDYVGRCPVAFFLIGHGLHCYTSDRCRALNRRVDDDHPPAAAPRAKPPQGDPETSPLATGCARPPAPAAARPQPPDSPSAVAGRAWPGLAPPANRHPPPVPNAPVTFSGTLSSRRPTSCARASWCFPHLATADRQTQRREHRPDPLARPARRPPRTARPPQRHQVPKPSTDVDVARAIVSAAALRSPRPPSPRGTGCRRPSRSANSPRPRPANVQASFRAAIAVPIRPHPPATHLPFGPPEHDRRHLIDASVSPNTRPVYASVALPPRRMARRAPAR